MKTILQISAWLLMASANLWAQKTSKNPVAKPVENPAYQSLQFRSIGPAVASGRVGDIAVDPTNPSVWYIAAASGGIWKTSNSGTTFQPIFDGQGSYSIGCLTIDPNNHNTIWAGTGENNNQRSVAYGDGVYKSEDGGQTWKNMGLSKSEHIGKIIIDPRNSNVIYVAAYGPLWSAGGERGIYKSIDGGKTWALSLNVSENTGFNEVHFMPGNPEIIYAAAHQRRRHEWTYISGGPESAVYRSLDGGKTWDKLNNGLPSGDVGRIGLAVTDADPDRIYAIVEADEESKGVYLSRNRGASWEKRSNWATAGNYYQEIQCHPKDPEIIYSLDTWAKISKDAGKSFQGLGEKNKHVDNHALYVFPDAPSHALMGCDGGLYETFDGAQTWRYFANLPITQFYRVTTDKQFPNYYVYGGTQDNNTLGGPSRTNSASGILNSDWFVTVGGDGFESQVDPTDPNIVYSQWQYGGLIRYDRRTGEAFDIKPQEGNNEPALRWNWDAPLLLSPHNQNRLYFSANKVFRSDDRGNTWKCISPDLSRGIDRNSLPVMGKVWSMDAIGKNSSTSIYGNITAFSESSLKEGFLVAGTDDGLIQISTDGGLNWNKTSTFSGVPDQVLVQNVVASRHNVNVVFAVFNNHRNGDFKPYIAMSEDGGKSWKPIQGNLPSRGSVYCIAEDPKKVGYLYCGTEFGVFFSSDNGKNWIQLKGGLPVICIRDIEIQEQADDMVLASFGRGFYILDDLHILRNLPETLEKPAISNPEKALASIFPIESYQIKNLATPLGHKGNSFQGASLYSAENPANGAVIHWIMNQDVKSLKELRKESEKEKQKNNQVVRYPSKDTIRLESLQESPNLLVRITNASGELIREFRESAKKGLKKTVWDGRKHSTNEVNFYTPDPDNPYDSGDLSAFVQPGVYQVQIYLVKDGRSEAISEKMEFEIQNSRTNEENQEMVAFRVKVEEIRRIVSGTSGYVDYLKNKVKFMKAAKVKDAAAQLVVQEKLTEIELRLKQVEMQLQGDRSISRREFETLPGIVSRIDNIVYGWWSTTQVPSSTQKEQLNLVKALFGPVYLDVQTIDSMVVKLEKELEILKAPATPGRLPEYK
jgi:photosystem II stability/assembly factor-like uncharacterized protein